MSGFSNTLKKRIVIIIILSMAVILALLHFTLYYLTRSAFERHMMFSVQGIATAAARVIENDIHRYLEFVDTRDIYSAYYIEKNKFFADIKTAGDLSYVYTTRLTDDGTYEFLLDGEPIGSENWSAPGDYDSWDAGKEMIYEGASALSFGLSDISEWGEFIVAYAPIRNPSGEVISLMGVDISGQSLYGYLNRIQFTLLLLYSVLLFAVWIVAMHYSHTIIEIMLKDKLTGAYAKRQHESLILRGIRKAVKKGHDLHLLLIDLDHFKHINDTYGHPFGDIVLSKTARIIINALRQGDYLIRYGGEEFIAVVQSARGVYIYDIAERIRIAVSEAVIYNVEHETNVQVTISIGISTYNANCKAADLISRADKAMYHAKRERNMVSIYTPSMDEEGDL